MKVTHKVYNSDNELVGYLINNKFSNFYYAKQNIDSIENLILTKNDKLRCKSNCVIENITLRQLNSQRLQELKFIAPFKRDISNIFSKWKKNNSNLILYLKGARQVGKTTELLKFAYSDYEYVIYINLSENLVLSSFIDNVINYGNKIFGLNNFCGLHNLPDYVDSSKTLIILDEIQVSSVVFNSLRTLLEQLSCHIAVTGSYLAAVMHSNYFQPAGNTYDVDLLPLSYREFCRAFNSESLLDSLSVVGKSDKSVYEKLTELYRLYLEVGGFPAVVNTYIKSRSIDECLYALRNLLMRFTSESSTYFSDTNSSAIFENVYTAAVSAQLREKKGTGKDLSEVITNFVKTDTKCPVTRQEINNAMTWLQYNGVLGVCNLYNQGDVFQILENRRYYYTDTGLLNYVCSLMPLEKSDISGLKAETFVYNELRRLYIAVTRKVIGDKPMCAVYKNYELDFVVFDKSNKAWGIEVKSNKSSHPKSLKIFKDSGLIDEAVIAEVTKGGVGKEFRTIPIYAVAEYFPYE